MPTTIGNTPPLSKQEETELFRRAQRGDGRARHQIALANQRLVIKIAISYRRRGLPIEDLVAEGNVGLMRAIDKFDLGRQCRFSTYAIHWVRQSMSRALRQKAHLVRAPDDVVRRLPRYRQAMASLDHTGAVEPRSTEIAQAMGATADEAERCAFADQALRRPTSLSIFHAGKLEASSAMNACAPDPAGALIEARDTLQELMQVVTPRQRLVLALRFGLQGYRPMTLQQVAKRFNLTRSRIGQIEKEALGKMEAWAQQRELMPDSGA